MDFDLDRGVLRKRNLMFPDIFRMYVYVQPIQ